MTAGGLTVTDGGAQIMNAAAAADSSFFVNFFHRNRSSSSGSTQGGVGGSSLFGRSLQAYGPVDPGCSDVLGQIAEQLSTVCCNGEHRKAHCDEITGASFARVFTGRSRSSAEWLFARHT